MSATNMTDFPKPPPGLALNHNSDLIKRLGSFLPQIKKANQELTEENQDGVQIDVRLEKANDDDSDDQEDAEDKPTIQIDMQLGDVETNKEIFDMLSTNENEGDDKTDAKSTGRPIDCQTTPKEQMVSEMLKKDGASGKKRKVLIEELS